MRVRAALAALLILLPVKVIAAPAAHGPQAPATSSASHCPRTTSYLADKSGLYRGQPLRPRKLTELPAGKGYMAVYRKINGCDAPMTMVEYKTQGRQH